MPPVRVEVQEYRSTVVPGLDVATARTLGLTGAVTATRDLDGGLRLTASSRVGVVRAGDVELVVRPKVGVARLLWLLGYARDPAGWRDDDITLDPSADLTTGLAVAFAHRAERALAGGVLRGYRAVDEASPVLRGRLREADQIRARLAVAVPLEIRHDDYTADIDDNRILATATRRLLRLPGVPAPTRAALHRIRTRLADVTPLTAGTPALATPVTRLTRRYQPALRLARLVLVHRGIDMPPAAAPGTLAATGFLFELNTVFEAWLTTTLRAALERRGGTVDGQRTVQLDEAGRLPARPDITWWDANRCLAVVDAKYKATATVPVQDLYQMIAYCTALGLTDGHLVYAAATPTTHVLRHSGIHIHTHAVDLGQPPAALLTQIDALATAIATSTRSITATGGVQKKISSEHLIH
ncbi:McrC family protein [Frankia sp. QA3]|uniref:McrC family protein n=1 Tax=Frankia sp. QA3 TaxID=710111 RepID=UPI000269BCB0|nr:McrBC 5-methylcytosine restriction system component [Frankia sp. QA3]EIV91782.1 McrBC 5-methylcytosine restriction system component [Frankia sp. QA3]